MYKFNLMLKRLFDIVSSGVAIVVLFPVWIGASVAIKKDSKGPIFFRQGRRTKDGRVFQMLKFRSMVVDAEKMGSGLFNYADDPRVTKVGRKLRDSSMDEIPQLFNIFKGDMSVVGPRPCVPCSRTGRCRPSQYRNPGAPARPCSPGWCSRARP